MYRSTSMLVIQIPLADITKRHILTFFDLKRKIHVGMALKVFSENN
jgi:hypothetical protein